MWGSVSPHNIIYIYIYTYIIYYIIYIIAVYLLNHFIIRNNKLKGKKKKKKNKNKKCNLEIIIAFIFSIFCSYFLFFPHSHFFMLIYFLIFS